MRRASAKRPPSPRPRIRPRLSLGPLTLGLVLGAVTTRGNGQSTASQAAQPLAPDGPPFPIGGPTSSAWCEEMITKAQELAGLASWMQEHPDRQEPAGKLVAAINNELETARLTAAGGDRLGRWTRTKSSFGGAAFERSLGNLDAAEVNLLRLAPASYLHGQLPSLQAHVNRYLPKDDPRRVQVERLALAFFGDPSVGAVPNGIHPTGLATPSGAVAAASQPAIGTVERECLIAAFHAANSQRRRILVRLRSFRNLIVGAAVLLTLLAVGLAAVGAAKQQWLPVCFLPENRESFVCPQAVTPVGNPQAVDTDALVAATSMPDDILMIELIGLVAAAVAGAFSLRSIRGTSTPYGVPLALTVLKLPLGALTAVLGLLLIRGEFVPGLSALDSSAQIVAWAILFGYSQQLFSRTVDTRARGLLDDLSGHGAAGDRQTGTG